MTGDQIVVRSYRDLIVWQKSIDLVTEIYRCTRAFPREEIYALSSQLRRAAVSVPSNVAEGHARLSTGEYKQFLGHAFGSLVEMETQIVIAQKLDYVDPRVAGDLLKRTAEIGKMLNGLLRSLSSANNRRASERYS
jgi:four helix bundle protein